MKKIKTLKEHEQELIKNLTTDGWKAKTQDLEYKDELYCVRAKKKTFFIFKRVHIYVLVKEVTEDNLEELIDLIKDNFLNYHAIWLAADFFSEKVQEFARNKQQIGLLKIEVK